MRQSLSIIVKRLITSSDKIVLFVCEMWFVMRFDYINVLYSLMQGLWNVSRIPVVILFRVVYFNVGAFHVFTGCRSSNWFTVCHSERSRQAFVGLVSPFQGKGDERARKTDNVSYVSHFNALVSTWNNLNLINPYTLLFNDLQSVIWSDLRWEKFICTYKILPPGWNCIVCVMSQL